MRQVRMPLLQLDFGPRFAVTKESRLICWELGVDGSGHVVADSVNAYHSLEYPWIEQFVAPLWE